MDGNKGQGFLRDKRSKKTERKRFPLGESNYLRHGMVPRNPTILKEVLLALIHP